MNYKINYLYFGDISKDKNLLNRFGYNTDNSYQYNVNNFKNTFDQNKNLPDFSDEYPRHNYDYYIKLIANYLIDTNKKSKVI